MSHRRTVMVDPYDPEELLVCPYDPVHKVARKRFTYHLIKCRKVSEREKEGGRKRGKDRYFVCTGSIHAES